MRSCAVPIALLALVPVCASACDCLIVYPICQEVQNSDAVFIGVVESVQPRFLDTFRSEGAKIPYDEMAKLRAEGNVEKLRAIYLDLAGELPAREREPLERAATIRDLDDSFNSLAAGGIRTRFRVLKDFKKDAKAVTIWTDPGECGIHFQTGETYLVYADRDEETGRMRTSICYRTRRLRDAGPDMDFLSRYPEASRLEGFVTTRRDQDRPTYTNRILDPASNVAVQLESPGGKRLSSTTDSEGRFWFDGLAQGTYRLSTRSTDPQVVRIPAKGCAMDVIAIQSGVPLQ